MRTNDAPREEDSRLIDVNRLVARATQNAKAKNARLKLLKERHEAYLEARRAEMPDEEDEYLDPDMPREL